MIVRPPQLLYSVIRQNDGITKPPGQQKSISGLFWALQNLLLANAQLLVCFGSGALGRIRCCARAAPVSSGLESALAGVADNFKSTIGTLCTEWSNRSGKCTHAMPLFTTPLLWLPPYSTLVNLRSIQAKSIALAISASCFADIGFMIRQIRNSTTQQLKSLSFSCTMFTLDGD